METIAKPSLPRQGERSFVASREVLIDRILKKMMPPRADISHEDRMDMRQELWVVCLSVEPQIVGKDSPVGYLYASLANHVRKWHSRRKTRPESTLKRPALAPEPAEAEHLAPDKQLELALVPAELEHLRAHTQARILPELLAQDKHNLLYLKAMGDDLLQARDLLELGLSTERANALLPLFRGARRDRFEALSVLFEELGERRVAETFRKRVEKAEALVLERLGRFLGIGPARQREAVAEFWAWFFRQRSTRL